jgi:hypothetical protein
MQGGIRKRAGRRCRGRGLILRIMRTRRRGSDILGRSIFLGGEGNGFVGAAVWGITILLPIEILVHGMCMLIKIPARGNLVKSFWSLMMMRKSAMIC